MDLTVPLQFTYYQRSECPELFWDIRAHVNPRSYTRPFYRRTTLLTSSKFAPKCVDRVWTSEVLLHMLVRSCMTVRVHTCACNHISVDANCTLCCRNSRGLSSNTRNFQPVEMAGSVRARVERRVTFWHRGRRLWHPPCSTRHAYPPRNFRVFWLQFFVMAPLAPLSLYWRECASPHPNLGF